MKLSIIIPVYNEQQTIEELIRRVSKAKLPDKLEKEIIVVDDGSKDHTPNILKKIKLPNLKVESFKVNQGKGSAVKKGLKFATGDMILIQDADLEYNPDDYSKLVKPILRGETEVVFGTRFIDYPLKLFGKNRTILPAHWLGNRLLVTITNLLYRSHLTDMETCYKVMRKEVFDSFVLKAKRFDIEPEITAQILKKGYQILELPIKVEPRTHQQGKKINWKDGIQALLTLIKYRL